MQAQMHTRGGRAAFSGGSSSRSPAACRVRCSAAASPNGHAPSHAPAAPLASKPSAAETARTVLDLVREGTLSTLSADGVPVGSPVSYTLDKAGSAWVSLSAPELHNLQANPACSLMVQPTGFPARALASVSLLGKIDLAVTDDSATSFRFNLDKALYFGGLDQTARGQEVASADFLAAEPDVLRTSAADLVKLWNEERAEDIYRIVSQLLAVPLTQMAYAELLWVDRLGMYVRTEIEGREPEVVRVPFYRAVLDERDARSVITMAAQIAWEADRAYTPIVPPMFSEASMGSTDNDN